MSLRTYNYGATSIAYRLVPEERKTLRLTVYPDMSVILRHPEALSLPAIDTFIKRKRIWLSTQLAFFAKFAKKRYKREYISGESYLYLGKQYQLIVRKTKADRIVLLRGKLLVETCQGVEDVSYTKGLKIVVKRA